MRYFSSVVAVVTSVFVFYATPAQSATVAWDEIEPAINTGVPAINGGTVGTVAQDHTGTVIHEQRSPWEDTTKPGETYTYIRGGSSAQWNFDGDTFDTLHLMWGSLDDWNTVEFLYYNGVTETQVDILLGSDVQFAGAPLHTDFINATITTDGVFNRIRFSSDLNSFEFTNLDVVNLPSPATMSVFCVALAVMGLRRKHRNTADGM